MLFLHCRPNNNRHDDKPASAEGMRNTASQAKASMLLRQST
jgi:hypothetical protein